MTFTYSAAQVAQVIPLGELGHVEEDDACICMPTVTLTRSPDGLLIVLVKHTRWGIHDNS